MWNVIPLNKLLCFHQMINCCANILVMHYNTTAVWFQWIKGVCCTNFKQLLCLPITLPLGWFNSSFTLQPFPCDLVDVYIYSRNCCLPQNLPFLPKWCLIAALTSTMQSWKHLMCRTTISAVIILHELSEWNACEFVGFLPQQQCLRCQHLKPICCKQQQHMSEKRACQYGVNEVWCYENRHVGSGYLAAIGQGLGLDHVMVWCCNFICNM